jgi:hypothetical protein
VVVGHQKVLLNTPKLYHINLQIVAARS